MIKKYLFLHHKLQKSFLFKALCVFFTAMILSCLSLNNNSFAVETSVIKLPILDTSLEKGLTLKNDKSYYTVYFMKPQTWKVQSGSNISIKFQHSAELIPSRSHLSIYINDKLAKKISLDKSSLTLKEIKIPLPLQGLGDYNKILFEVEQHYVDICEDPLDPSLWTYIHPDTNVTYKYNIIQPKVDLKKYPFPLFDPYTYDTNTVNYIVPKALENSLPTLEALSIVSADLAQHIEWHKLKYIASSNTKDLNNNLNNVIIGTPNENPALFKLNSALGNIFKTSNNNAFIVDKRGNALPEDQGLIKFIKNPKNKNRAILVITANSAEGVKKAAQYLVHNDLIKKLKGNTALIKDYNPEKDHTNNIPKYIYNKDMTLKELGFKERKSERIGPPPLVYPVRVIPDMTTTNENLSFELTYSYGPKLNDELSTVEVSINGISLAGAKLTNQDGEKNQKLLVEIPSHLVKPYNDLSVTFHLYPFKYDYCKNYYVDDLWGTVSEESKFYLPSSAKIIQPNLALLNDLMFPYSVSQDLSSMAVVLPDNPKVYDYQAMLDVIGAVGKTTNSDAGINLVSIIPSFSSEADISGRNLILIGNQSTNSMINNLEDNILVRFKDNYKFFKPHLNDVAELKYYNNLGFVQQIISTFDSNRVITVLFGQTGPAVISASTLLSDNKKLKKLEKGNFVAVSNNTTHQMAISQKEEVAKEQTQIDDDIESESFNIFSLLWKICFGIIIIFVILFIIRTIIGIIFGRKDK